MKNGTSLFSLRNIKILTNMQKFFFEILVRTALTMVGKVLYTSLYTWSDLMICFDSEFFQQNFVGQYNNDRKSLKLHYDCLK